MILPKYFKGYIIFTVIGIIFLTSCELLDVDNPNSLTESSLKNPKSADAMANGAEASLTRAVGYLIGPYEVISDEFDWVGSRDDWRRLNQGDITDPSNEYIIGAFEYIAEARYVGDDYIERLEHFKNDGSLSSNKSLVRVYLYGAIGRITIADMYDNFVFSNKQDYGSLIGEDKMNKLYDTAITYVNKALDLSPSIDIKKALIGVRARAKFGKKLWAKVNPVGKIDIDNPLANSPGAAADADSALNLMDPDYRYQLVNNPSLNLVVGDHSLADQVNQRLELRIGDTYVAPTSNGKQIDSVIFKDPIDDVVQPFIKKRINEFTNANQYANYTIISAREMHLIIAETALANNDMDKFTTQINDIRTEYGLTPYSDQISPLKMLIHARQSYLFLQGRRLRDQYRFKIPSSNWIQRSDAIKNPGTFLPVSKTEIDNNPNIE